MFGFIRRRWSRDHQRDSTDIFTFFDGTSERRADPLAVGDSLESACPKYADLIDLLADGTDRPPGPATEELERQKKEAFQELVRAARAVFGVPAFERGGLTQKKLFSLLVGFLQFMADSARVARPFVSSPPRASPSLPASPTASSAASGSSGTGSPPSGSGG